MLLLGAILLAIFVLPSPWGIVVVVAGGFMEIGESLAVLRWSRRRRSVSGVEALVGRRAVVSSPGQVKVAGELWEARSEESLHPGDQVEVEGVDVDGLTLLVSRPSRAPR